LNVATGRVFCLIKAGEREAEHMGWIQASAAGLPNFVIYLALGVVLTLLFAAIYTRLTGHDEITLIRQHNSSAAIAFGGNLIGFVIPLNKAISQASSVPDCILWATVALAVQLGIYGFARLLVPGLSKNIENNAMASAVLLASVSVVGGMINAASMTLYPIPVLAEGL
jgi:putative membrane protein